MHKSIVFCLLLVSLIGINNNNVFSQENIISEVSFFEDSQHIHDLTSVKKEKFQKAKDNIVRLGITKSTVWVHINLNPAKLDTTAVLEIDSPFLDEIILFYTTQEGKQVSDTLGIMYSQSKNKLNHHIPAFEIPLKNVKSPEVFLKVNSRWAMAVSPVMKQKEVFYKEKGNIYFVTALLLGGLICMAIYNLFLFFSLRDYGYLLYVLALVSTIVTQGYVLGFYIHYITPEWTEFSFRIPVVSMLTTCVFSSWFALKFLNFKKQDGIFYYLLVLFTILPIPALIIEFLEFDYLSRKITIVISLAVSFVIYLSSLDRLIKGHKIALYFNIAWTIYLIGVVLYAFNRIGILPENMYTKNFVHIGSFIEVMVLSFALGHKYNLVRKEKEKLEKQTKEELEALVKIQTNELAVSLEEKEVLLREIHHRVKNNLQIVISLLDLQVASAKNSKNKKVLLQSKSRVYSMSLIHQKLYQSDNLARINLKSYLEELLYYVKNSYTSINSPIKYQISVEDVELSLTQAVPLGLIVNELLTNSLKYGVEEGNTANQIQLKVATTNEQLEMVIADSGRGFENKETHDLKDSLGLFLIKSLNRQLRGKMDRYFESEMFMTRLVFPMTH
ncbi:7TM diverse intracellular signaling domain-containing protein [Kordia jejudonensis]|uniref:7TM diverse intracellular signaling domain-containing protein n=1 Tax=Kordia jejudonensis TaxID=1348245 RepID=UPI00069A09EF|nr:7TM diverse intracellular signaling domain-containing protein [Kordia jejudonensis]